MSLCRASRSKAQAKFTIASASDGASTFGATFGAFVDFLGFAIVMSIRGDAALRTSIADSRGPLLANSCWLAPENVGHLGLGRDFGAPPVSPKRYAPPKVRKVSDYMISEGPEIPRDALLVEPVRLAEPAGEIGFFGSHHAKMQDEHARSRKDDDPVQAAQ